MPVSKLNKALGYCLDASVALKMCSDLSAQSAFAKVILRMVTRTCMENYIKQKTQAMLGDPKTVPNACSNQFIIKP